MVKDKKNVSLAIQVLNVLNEGTLSCMTENPYSRVFFGKTYIAAHLPALPVKNTFLPLNTARSTAACSLFSFRVGRDRMGFLFGFVFT